MKNNQEKMHNLLVEYQQLNQKLLLKVQRDLDIPTDEIQRQVVEPPASMDGLEISSFDPRNPQRLTAMLQARFSYAGSWKMAEAGIEWLSLNQIKSASLSVQNVEMVHEATTLWEGSSLFRVPLSRISLFGIHPKQGEMIYLIWPVIVGEEPEIISYSCNIENRYLNLEHYLKSLIGDAKKGLQSRKGAGVDS